MAPGRADSSVDEASTALYRDSKKFLTQMNKAVAKFEAAVLEATNSLARPSLVKPLRTAHNIDAHLTEIRALIDTITDFESRFLELIENEKQCRKTLFFRAKYILTQLEKSRFSLYHLLQCFVETLIQILAGRNNGFSEIQRNDWAYILEIVVKYNDLIASDPKLNPQEEKPSVILVHTNYNTRQHLHENFTSLTVSRIKQITASRILTILAHERSWFAVTEIVRSIVLGLDSRSLELASDDLTWLNIPISIGSAPPTVYEPRKSSTQNGKNKDGDGNKRKNKELVVGSPTSDYHSQNGKDSSHLGIITEFVAAEELFLNELFYILAEYNDLLGRAALKPKTDGSKEKIRKSVRQKMAEFYHDVLWKHVGDLAEKTLMWGGGNVGLTFVPYGLQHPRLVLALANVLQDNLYASFGDSYPSLVFPCMHLLAESLNLHVIAISWDLLFVSCLAESSRPKTAQIAVKGMRSGSQASKTGKLICDTITALVRLSNRCWPDVIRDFVEHGGHDPEEFPFIEELHILRRLHATVYFLKNWATGKASATLHTWQVQDFLLITQCDLQNAYDCFGQLHVSDHSRLLSSKSVSIQLFAHAQQALSKEVQECQLRIKSLPESSMVDMSKYCRTISLATLQNIFPLEKYWRQNIRHEVSTPSEYVNEYIDRIIAPVFASVQSMVVEIQQNVARIVLKTFCESWLEHIKTRKVKFSEYGASQLSQDFKALRTWIGDNPHIKDESRRYLLLLDSIRQCEGVAKLLLCKPGVVEMKNAGGKNRVVPVIDETGMSTIGGTESPVNQILESIPAELYVQNQQQWISLKTSSKLILPFCCK